MNKFKIKVLVGFALVCGMIFAPGCEKVDTDLTYKVVPYLDLPDVDSLIPYARYVEIYAYQRDTTDWWVTSWEDAGKAIISAKEGGGKSDEFVIKGVLSSDNNSIMVGPFTDGPVMLVAYDTERHAKYQSKMYAWRQVAIEPGVAEVRIPVIFAPEGSTRSWINTGRNPGSEMYDNSRWFIANDNPWVEPKDSQTP